MMRKILCCASLGGFLLASLPAIAAPKAQEQGGKQSQQQQATKSISGKVTAIGDQGKSFSVEVGDGGSKRTMQFAVDRSTQVQGEVRAGTMVLVEYLPSTDGGQNLCVKVSAQQS